MEHKEFVEKKEEFADMLAKAMYDHLIKLTPEQLTQISWFTYDDSPTS